MTGFGARRRLAFLQVLDQLRMSGDRVLELAPGGALGRRVGAGEGSSAGAAVTSGRASAITAPRSYSGRAPGVRARPKFEGA